MAQEPEIDELIRFLNLRGGAAFVIAALAAEGTSEISGLEYIVRGNENIRRDLRLSGVRACLKNHFHKL